MCEIMRRDNSRCPNQSTYWAYAPGCNVAACGTHLARACRAIISAVDVAPIVRRITRAGDYPRYIPNILTSLDRFNQRQHSGT